MKLTLPLRLGDSKGHLVVEEYPYPRHQNDYMQLFLFLGINFLKITTTSTFFNP